MSKLFALLLFTSLSTYSFAQQAEHLFEQSVAKAEQGRLLDAQVLIDKAVTIEPTNPNYYLWKSNLYVQQRDIEGAFQSAYRALHLAPKNEDVYNEIGSLYQAVNMCDSAVSMYTQAIRYARNDTSQFMYLCNIASVKLGFMDYANAIVDLEHVLAFDPHSFATLNNIAIAYVEVGRTNEAILALEKAVDKEPNYPGTYVNLARLYTKTDRYSQALSYYKQAIELTPDEPLVYSNRGELYYRMKQYDKAIVNINKSIDMYPTNSYAYRNRALVYMALGKQEEGCRDLAAAKHYGFATNYGDEVEQLTQEHCQSSSKLTQK